MSELSARSRCSSIELARSQHAQDGEHAARARRARLEHLVGIDQEILAHAGTRSGARRPRRGARCSSEPSKRLGSVRTETAAAPPLRIAPRRARRRLRWPASSSPTAGERSFTRRSGRTPSASFSGGARRQVRDARAQLASPAARLRRRRRARGSSRHVARGNRQPLSGHAPAPAPNAASASSVCARRRCRWPRSPARTPSRGIGDAADDLERQRRAEQQRVAVRAAVLTVEHRAQRPRVVRGVAAGEIAPPRSGRGRSRDGSAHLARSTWPGRTSSTVNGPSGVGSSQPARAVDDEGALDRQPGQRVGHELRASAG